MATEDSYFTNSKWVDELTPRDFDDVVIWKLKSKKCSAILFYAPWCPWCKKVKDVWEQLGKTATFMDTLAFDCEKYKEHLMKIKEDLPELVRSFPTIIFYKNQQPIETFLEQERTYDNLLKASMSACDASANSNVNSNESNDTRDSIPEGEINKMPLEIFREILVKVPINKISAWCRTKKFFMGLCRNKFFWQDYIAGDQERLHQLLVELARQGDFNLFSWLWKTPICLSLGCKEQLIKERRSLVAGFIAAYNGGDADGNEEIANLIWNIESEFMLWHFNFMDEDGSSDNDFALRIQKILLKLRKLASNGDRVGFEKLYKDLSSYEDDSIQVEIWESEILGAHSKDIEFLNWGIKLMGITDYSSIIDFVLTAGRLDLFKIFDDRRAHTANYDMTKILESSNPDGMKFLMKDFPMTIITPANLSAGNIAGLGNRDILLNHMRAYPQDLSILLESGRTLEAKEFMTLLKTTMANSSKEGLTSKVWNEFMVENEREGRTYLSRLFGKEIKMMRQIRK